MALVDRVSVARRFQKSVRIDTDLKDAASLEGFVCPQSSSEVLRRMARHIHESGQGAFTWTGPYGSGKSSLVVALSALLSGSEAQRQKAARAVGEQTAEDVWAALPPGQREWGIVPVVGRREHPARVIREALSEAGYKIQSAKAAKTEKALVDQLAKLAGNQRTKSPGLIVFIDELGKFLEHAAQEGSDIYLFQELAEAASRSGGRLIVVGILHQAFEEYAHRLSREMRDEWSKIQGRFVDLAVNTAGEEQIDLLSRAIESDHKAAEPGKLAREVAGCITQERPGVSEHLPKALEECWPLHPIVAALLGPISRRRFGQNQRSLFGFLNSAEPHGFQDFLRHAGEDELYGPEKLWDYLRVNLEPAILASPDGHRWAMASEAVERCEAVGGNDLHVRLLKTVALVDLFRERSGLTPSVSLLQAATWRTKPKQIEDALADLRKWSLVIYRKHLGAFAIYAGSDFDIDGAVETALQEIQDIDFQALRSLAGLQPVLAKRHYHETGTLRWFDVDIAPLNEVGEVAEAYRGEGGTIGKFLLAIPTAGETEQTAKRLCREASRRANQWDVVVGLSPRAWAVTELARELLAIEKVRNETTELQGDAVARREVKARLAALQGQLEGELRRAFDHATWYMNQQDPLRLLHAELNVLASKLARKRFPKTPKIHNELLNRTKPSSSAVAAQNALLRRMVGNEGQDRLGIEGYPAEGGLFDSLLGNTGLYARQSRKWGFADPRALRDPSGLAPVWKAASDYLQKRGNRTVSIEEIYEIWRQPPFGIKDGLLPVLGVAFLLSQRGSLAFYREGIFQPRFTDLDVDYLVKDAASIQLRWMDISELSRRLLSEMAEVVRQLDQENDLTDLAPIDVARGLIAIYDQLPRWTTRTMQLSSNAVHIRNLFKQANDPNKFLFDDLPAQIGQNVDLTREEDVRRVVKLVHDGLSELRDAYPKMLRRLNETMLAELQVPNDSAQALAELRSRAENIKEMAGDFRLNAFISRLTTFQGKTADIEGIASLAANKPPRDWVDADLDGAAIEITDMAQKFVRTETFARVKGRTDKRHAMAVMVGLEGRPAPMLQEFDIADGDREAVDHIVSTVEDALQGSNPNRRNVILAALAELSARYMQPHTEEEKADKRKQRVAS